MIHVFEALIAIVVFFILLLVIIALAISNQKNDEGSQELQAP